MTKKTSKKPVNLSLSGVSGKLAATGFGDPARPKILALHGWLDNAASFEPLAALLDEHYIVALDFAGHGRSERRPEGSIYHMTDYVSDIAHALRELGWDKCVLMGHSLGAGVALLYAALFPQQVTQLVMIDGLGPATAGAETAVERMRNAVNANLDPGDSAKRSPRVYPDWDKLVNARMLASPLAETSAELLLARGTTLVDGGVRVNADPRLKHPSAIYLSEDVVLQFIGEVRSPALLILAEQGMVASRSATAGRIEQFSNILVEYLPGRHHLHMDTPAPVAAVVNAFLADQQAAKAG